MNKKIYEQLQKETIVTEYIIKEIDKPRSDDYIPMEVPNIDSSFKAYMDYRTITNKNSEQYKLQELATTDDNGLRTINGKYLVALGTYYSDGCGEEFDVLLDSGKTIRVITGDIKQDIHTDDKNMMTKVTDTKCNILEFIVDTRMLDEKALRLGDVSCLGLEGNIVSINKIIK